MLNKPQLRVSSSRSNSSSSDTLRGENLVVLDRSIELLIECPFPSLADPTLACRGENRGVVPSVLFSVLEDAKSSGVICLVNTVTLVLWTISML